MAKLNTLKNSKPRNFEIVTCVSQAGDDEERKRERQARITKMESLTKELEGLLKQDGKTVFSNDNPVLLVFFILYCFPHAKILHVLHCFSCPFAGLSFLTPVIGFYCQKCEEFIGDLTSAESHAAIHGHSNSSSVSILLMYLWVDKSGDILYFYC